MRTKAAVGFAVMTAVTLGIAAGITYAAVPNKSGDTNSTLAGVTGLHVVTGGPQTYNKARLKQGKAVCPAGEAVISGGYTLVGNWQLTPLPVLKNTPAVTVSEPRWTSDTNKPPNMWFVEAVAPSGFVGKWALRPQAICGKAS